MKFQPARGTRDVPASEMIQRQHVLAVITNIYEKYGFDPLDTPAFEDWKLLAAKAGGGEGVKDEIYYFKDKSDRELGLRFDLTVPLGRYVASNPDIPKPFRRYQVGRVWRYDKPGALRWREFIQADADIVGSSSIEADAECIRAACEIFTALGFTDFVIRINNRKITETFVKSLGIKNTADVFRIVDKLEKIGEKGVVAELKEKKIKPALITRILSFVRLKDLNAVKKEIVSDGIDELEQLFELLPEYRNYLQIDMSLVRGLEYYTGPVFEIEGGAGVSVGGGGRYDNLVEVFEGPATPAVGISIGVDRLIAAMQEKKMFALPATNTKLFVVTVAPTVKPLVREVVRKLRDQGVASEFDLMGRSLSKQLQYVNSRKIPYVLVIGEKEQQSGNARIRNMTSGDETDVVLQNIDSIRENIK